MSCVANISAKPTAEQIRLANEQRLKYSSPKFSESKLLRLEKLAIDRSAAIRSRVAADPNIPDHIQWALSCDSAVEVRAAIARNPKSDWMTLDHLAKDPESRVRGEVALNDNTTIYSLCALVEDEDPVVSRLAQWKVDVLYPDE